MIGIAETGSGKTLGFLAPGMVHIMAQEELKWGEGPICVVLAPTRELVQQIMEEAEFFSRDRGPSQSAQNLPRVKATQSDEFHFIIIA